MSGTLQNFTRATVVLAVSAVVSVVASGEARAVDLSAVMFAGPGMARVAEQAETVDVERSPKRQPYELKRIYRRYRTVFRTVAKGVDLSQELFGVETRGDTLRVRFRPTSANPDRMGGVLSCQVRF